jgi:hypothetical protein
MKTNLLWGTYTWQILHWMGENVHEPFFNQKKGSVLGVVNSILSTLPCPTCRQHAKQYINAYPLNRIKNLLEFRQYLFRFHNAVNTRLRRKLPKQDILNKYKSLNITQVVRNWNLHFKDPIGMNTKDFWLKQRISNTKHQVLSFFKQNYMYFIPIPSIDPPPYPTEGL